MQNTRRQMELRISLYRKVETFKGRVRDTNTQVQERSHWGNRREHREDGRLEG